MLRRFYASRTDMDPVMRACHIHNELLRIYPFEKNNEATARAMFNFELLAANLPPIPFTMDRQSYCQAIISHISKEDPQPFYRMTADILCDRFDQLLDIL